MPTGNGGPFGLPSQPLGVLQDERSYDTKATLGGGGIAPTSGLYTPINGPIRDVYGKVVASTPGLVHWWRFDKSFTSWGSQSSNAPFFANSAGAITFWSHTAGTPTLGPSLLPGVAGKSVRLNNSWLEGFDYNFTPGCHEVATFELWVKPVTFATPYSVIAGAYDTSNGWNIGVTPAGLIQIQLTGASALSTANGTIVAGKTYHVVAVVGGTQGPNPDYTSRLYVNGVEVVNGSLPSGTVLYPAAGSAGRMAIGNADGGAFNNWDAYVDDVAVYSRMLQPVEVLQHYQAAFARA